MPVPALAARGVVGLLVGLAACGLGPSTAAGEGDPPWSGLVEALELHVEELRVAPDNAQSDVGAALERRFQQEVRQRRLADWTGLPDAGMVTLFDAAYTVAFYSGSPASADHLVALHQELRRRGDASVEQARKVVRSLMVARRFDRAGELADQYQLGLAVPTVARGETSPDAPGVLRLSQSGTLVHESADLTGMRLLVVGSPACGFFRRAVAELPADPALAAWVESHALVLLPALEPPDPDRLAEWNDQYPEWQLQVPYAADQWPWIRRWSTPAFYLRVDGVLKDHFIGWPDPDRLSRLRAMIQDGGGVIDRPGGR
jgi:hypothetical protein